MEELDDQIHDLTIKINKLLHKKTEILDYIFDDLTPLLNVYNKYLDQQNKNAQITKLNIHFPKYVNNYYHDNLFTYINKRISTDPLIEQFGVPLNGRIVFTNEELQILKRYFIHPHFANM